MPNLNFQLAFAILIPDFIYQFLMNNLIDNNNFTCLELEDIRNSIHNKKKIKLKKIKKFLMLNNKKMFSEKNFEKIIKKLEYELAEVDNEYYHKYTAEELKYIFEEIIHNINIIYDAYKKEFGSNLILTIGFKFKNGPEANMVIEFLDINESPECLENVYFLTMKNCFVSDNIIARVYFNLDEEKQYNYEVIFNEIFDVMNLKQKRNNFTPN